MVARVRIAALDGLRQCQGRLERQAGERFALPRTAHRELRLLRQPLEPRELFRRKLARFAVADQ